MKSIGRLDVLREMYLRGLIDPHSELEREYFRRKRGHEGELYLLGRLQELLPQNTTILHDIKLEYHGLTQVDLLVLLDGFWWVFEAKNYQGLMEYQDDACYLRGKPLWNDQFAAMRTRMRVVEGLAHALDPAIQIVGAMVFVHPDGEVTWTTEESFRILTRNQLRRYVTTTLVQQSMPSDRVLAKYQDHLNSHLGAYPEELPQLTTDHWERIRRGFRCPECHSYRWIDRHKYLRCQVCHGFFAKGQLLKELYQQWCILNLTNNASPAPHDVYEMSHHQVHQTTIRKWLRQIPHNATKEPLYNTDKINK